ncbi:cAMP-dependent protein kinase, partial [Toxoplasma gondii ARI]
ADLTQLRLKVVSIKMRTSVALFFAAAGGISLVCAPQVSLAAPVQGTLGPDVADTAGEPVVLQVARGADSLPDSRGNTDEEGITEVATTGVPPQTQSSGRSFGQRVMSWFTSAQNAIRRQRTDEQGTVPGPSQPIPSGTDSTPEGWETVQSGDVPPGEPEPKAPTRSPRQRARDMFGRVGRFFGGARRFVGRGWRRFTTGMAGVTDRVRGRLALRSSFEFATRRRSDN